jgi:rhamnose utilization protein RhaD (predicted bifunctional aldolase and dehydrogenase)
VTMAAKLEPVPAGFEPEMDALRELSARVGSEPLLVQASNGNTSIKVNGTLWIKASGRWLANATREELFMGVGLAAINRSLHGGLGISARYDSKDDLRPSIETPMHAAIPHRVVIHVHSINAISWAIRLDGPEQIKDRLAGLHWQWIPYAPSGNPLAREIAKAAGRAPETDVFILGSHGLVVCGKDCDAAEKLLREVDWRLALPPRKFPKPNLDALKVIARFPGWEFPEVQAVHALATDPRCRNILQGGILYPCQAIFLGQKLAFLPAWMAESRFKEWLDVQQCVPAFVAVEGIGVMINTKMTRAERATLRALAEVTLRAAEPAPLRYLTEREVAEVLRQGAHGGKDVIVMPARTSSVPHYVTQYMRHSVAHSLTDSLTHSLTYSLTTIRRLDMGRKGLDNLNACAAWLGSHSRKLRSRIASARTGLGA